MDESDREEYIEAIRQVLKEADLPKVAGESSGNRWMELACKVVFPLISTALASAVRVLIECALGG